MQHTNSKRGPDGRFGDSKGPKAKRIEVWLQPQTVELLDTLTTQWGVGRGKVIDQLLTRGPVPPQSWSEVTESPPTPSAPPEPKAEPSPSDFVADWGALPANASKRQWIAVNVTLNADLTPSGYGVENPLDQTLRTVAAIRKEGVNIGKACNPGAMPQFRFLMNVETAAPFTAGYDIPQVAIDMAVKYVGEVFPKTKPTPSGPFRDQEVRAANAPGPKNRKVWQGVRVDYTLDHRLKFIGTDQGQAFTAPNALQLETAQSFGAPIFGAGISRTNSGIPHSFRFRFAINANDGTPWLNGLDVPDGAVDEVWKALQAAKPTPSGRPTLFDDPELQAMQDKMTQQWDICKADARVIGCKPERVQQFKAAHKIKQDRPMSVDAQQLLREELENDQRSANGEANALQQRLQRLKERATLDRLQRVFNVLQEGFCALEVDVAKVFLLEALEDVGIKRRSKLVKGVWADLEQLIPQVSAFEFDWGLPEDATINRCLFWGTAIRLATLDGEPPQDTAKFLDWCGYSVHQSEQERKTNQWWSDFARTMTGKPSTTSDRTVLDLPAGGQLTAQAIKAAYKTAAKKAHPDLGGTAEQMTRINEAKVRLLLEVEA